MKVFNFPSFTLSKTEKKSIFQGHHFKKEKELEKKTEDISYSIPYIDKPLIIQNVKHFSELAKKRIEKLQPRELQEFLGYLIDEIAFDSNKMEAKILGHIPVMNKTDDSSHNSLFYFPPGLMPATRNNKLTFEIDVKV